jgi:hypothetical protein
MVCRNVKQLRPDDQVSGNIAGTGWGGLSDTYCLKSVANNFGIIWIMDVIIL